jgi:hypothetical protein
MAEPRWHRDEQEFLAKLEKQCNTYQAHYNSDHLYYVKLSTRFNIPILVVSAINALTAVGLNSFIEQKYVSVLNAVLSAGTGVLGSIQLYLKLNEKLANSLRAAILMKRLALKVSKELSIDMDNRVTDGQAFLGECFAEFNTALEQGNPLEKEMDNHLAFTQIIKKPGRFSLLENSIRPGDSRAKRLWSLGERARTNEGSQPGSQSPLYPSDSSQGGDYQEGRDVELGVRSS